VSRRRSLAAQATTTAALLLLLVGCGGPRSSDDAGSAASAAAPSITADAAAACPGAGTLASADAPFRTTSREPVLVYVPACYAQRPNDRFPVLYLLHGAGADETQWTDIGTATAADSLIDSGAIGPMIIVMPDGGPAVSDQLVDGLSANLVPWTDRTYRTIPDRGSRAVGGISRGGRIALLSAGLHGDQFGSVGGHSPAVSAPDAAPDVLAGLTDPSIAIEIDVGEDDLLRGGAEAFAGAIAGAGGATQVVISAGGHTRAYWRQHVSDYLRFYGQHLAGAGHGS
jgi:enterochelin esterase family protein